MLRTQSCMLHSACLMCMLKVAHAPQSVRMYWHLSVFQQHLCTLLASYLLEGACVWPVCSGSSSWRPCRASASSRGALLCAGDGGQDGRKKAGGGVQRTGGARQRRGNNRRGRGERVCIAGRLPRHLEGCVRRRRPRHARGPCRFDASCDCLASTCPVRNRTLMGFEVAAVTLACESAQLLCLAHAAGHAVCQVNCPCLAGMACDAPCLAIFYDCNQPTFCRPKALNNRQQTAVTASQGEAYQVGEPLTPGEKPSG